MENPMHEYGCRYGLGGDQGYCLGCEVVTDDYYGEGVWLCWDCCELTKADKEQEQDR